MQFGVFAEVAADTTSAGSGGGGALIGGVIAAVVVAIVAAVLVARSVRRRRSEAAITRRIQDEGAFIAMGSTDTAAEDHHRIDVELQSSSMPGIPPADGVDALPLQEHEGEAMRRDNGGEGGTEDALVRCARAFVCDASPAHSQAPSAPPGEGGDTTDGAQPGFDHESA